MTSNSNNTPITQTSSTNNNTTQVDEPTTIQIPNSTNGKRNPIRKKPIRTLIDDYFQKISNNQRTPTAIKTTNINPKQKQFRQTILLTTPRANESWGANFHDKAPNHIRIYFQNVNSLKIKQKTIGKWHE
jgi:hypothetical protein